MLLLLVLLFSEAFLGGRGNSMLFSSPFHSLFTDLELQIEEVKCSHVRWMSIRHQVRNIVH
jgi:hypothetical protein